MEELGRTDQCHACSFNNACRINCGGSRINIIIMCTELKIELLLLTFGAPPTIHLWPCCMCIIVKTHIGT